MVSSVTAPPEIKRGHFRIGQRGHYSFGLTRAVSSIAVLRLLGHTQERAGHLGDCRSTACRQRRRLPLMWAVRRIAPQQGFYRPQAIMGARNRQRPSWIRGRDAIKILNELYPRSPRTPQSSSMIRGAAKASWKLDWSLDWSTATTAQARCTDTPHGEGDPARLRLAGRSARQRTLACPAGGATPLTACPPLPASVIWSPRR